jgi:hypothetical protein
MSGTASTAGDSRAELEHRPGRAAGDRGGDAELEGIVGAYMVWLDAEGWHAALRELPPLVEAETRAEMRTKLIRLGKFSPPSGEERM